MNLHFKGYDWFNGEKPKTPSLVSRQHEPKILHELISSTLKNGYCLPGTVVKNITNETFFEFFKYYEANPNQRILFGYYLLVAEGFPTDNLSVDELLNAYFAFLIMIFLHFYCPNYYWEPDYNLMSVLDIHIPIIKHLTINDFIQEQFENRVRLLEKTLL